MLNQVIGIRVSFVFIPILAYAFLIMKDFCNRRPVIAGVAMLIGLILGYILKGDEFRQTMPQSGFAKNASKWADLDKISGKDGRTIAHYSLMSDLAYESKRNEIVKEDWERAKELGERERQGEYILKWESPVAAKLLSSFLIKIVARASTNNAAEYEEVFSRLGIDAKQREVLKLHLAKIHRASLETEGAMQQVLYAKLEFDKRLHDTLSEEAYDEYRDYEATKPAIREYSHFRDWLTTSNVAVPCPKEEQVIVRLIKRCQAFTDISWVGPYEGMPQIAVGLGACAANLEEQIERIIDSARKLDVEATKSKISDGLRITLKDYYAYRVEQKRQAFTKSLQGRSEPNSEKISD